MSSIAGTLPQKISSSLAARKAGMIEGMVSPFRIATAMMRNGSGDGRPAVHTTWKDVETFMKTYPDGTPQADGSSTTKTDFVIAYYTDKPGSGHAIGAKFKNGKITFRDYQAGGKKDHSPNAHMKKAEHENGFIMVFPVNNVTPVRPGQEVILNERDIALNQLARIGKAAFIRGQEANERTGTFSDFKTWLAESQKQGLKAAENNPFRAAREDAEAAQPTGGLTPTQTALLSKLEAENATLKDQVARRDEHIEQLKENQGKMCRP
jgi:hypothetical protein